MTQHKWTKKVKWNGYDLDANFDTDGILADCCVVLSINSIDGPCVMFNGFAYSKAPESYVLRSAIENMEEYIIACSMYEKMSHGDNKKCSFARLLVNQFNLERKIK